MSRALQHQLHTRIETAAAMLDLPLTAQHVERLAVELTPAIKALLAETLATAEETAPVRCALTPQAQVDDELAGVRTTEYAGCICRISVDVDEDSPAALLAAELRGRQPDVIATDVPTATYLGLTVRPQSWQAWRWWLNRLNISADAVNRRGTAVYAVGVVGEVAVQVCGDGVPKLLEPRTVEDDVTPPVQKLRALLAGQRSASAPAADGITRRIAPTQALTVDPGEGAPRCANPKCGRPVPAGAVWCSTWCHTEQLPGAEPTAGDA
ncbi:hypothetical protein [Streptomyces kebangsaanensis]|uniref:hypothetical protein n=1 Tax=Streptomyces kebangsaanensis TaxID=864058 RepID=UPI00093BD96B|nr:hypothetical protein [Streptomyces kebangsaanensis]